MHSDKKRIVIILKLYAAMKQTSKSYKKTPKDSDNNS